MGQEVALEDPEEIRANDLLREVLPEIPFRLIIDLLDYIPIHFAMWNRETLKWKDFFGYFALDRFRHVFVLFRNFVVLNYPVLRRALAHDCNRVDNDTVLDLMPLSTRRISFFNRIVPPPSLSCFPDLECLSGVTISSDDVVTRLSASCPCLLTLHCTLGPDVSFDHLNSAFPQLETLAVTKLRRRQQQRQRQRNPQSDDSSTSLRILSSLQTLHLSGCLKSSSGLLVPNPTRSITLPSLRRLRLARCCLKRPHLEFLLFFCPSLRNLRFESCSVEEDSIRLLWEVIGREDLVKVTLNQVEFRGGGDPFGRSVDEDALVLFFSPGSRLRRLSWIRYVENSALTPPREFVESLVRNCQFLEGLELDWMTDELLECFYLEEENDDDRILSLYFGSHFLSREAVMRLKDNRPNWSIWVEGISE